jgi:hypothetical protein
MSKRFSLLLMTAAVLCGLLPAHVVQAATADRAEVEARVRADVAQDLDSPRQPESLVARTCLDGRPVADFPGDVVEIWANLECPYCGILEPMQAQRQNAGACIVVRHIPTREYGESMKKALAYEALKKFSVNAANLFWDKVLPKTPKEMPLPYESSLLLAFQEAAIDPDAFGEALGNEAASIVNQDILAGRDRISVTPTWVLTGIRFPACDFTAAQFPVALELAKKTVNGDKDALERVITVITNGMMDEPIL